MLLYYRWDVFITFYFLVLDPTVNERGLIDISYEHGRDC